MDQLVLVSPSPSCSIVFLVLKQGLGTYLSFTMWSAGTAKSPALQFGFFFGGGLLVLGLVI